MTQATEKKVKTLIRITQDNLPRVKKAEGDSATNRSPFVGSAAKYYPALKKLADK